MVKQNHNIWWGPPKKFSIHIAERKISWLELFYDLVYVIVISKITRYLAGHPSVPGLLDYGYLFAMTFWGWYNGSMYHDFYGSPGIRTRFMTLWQMLAVGALAVSLDSPPESILNRATIAILFLQLFITYLWWSVGLYDREYRKLNLTHTIWFLGAFVLLITTFWVPFPYKRIIFWVALVINHIPFVLMAKRYEKSNVNFTLSPNMTERLGLFTIIIFGEAILGVVNGVSHLPVLDINVWLCFCLGIVIVFALWWIFFSIIADRKCKEGMQTGNVMSLLYLPTLSSLGMVGAAFPALMENTTTNRNGFSSPLQIIFGASITIFLCCVAALCWFLIYPIEYEKSKKRIQLSLILIGISNLLLIFLFPMLPVFLYLLCVFISLMIVIVLVTYNWSRIELTKLSEVP